MTAKKIEYEYCFSNQTETKIKFGDDFKEEKTDGFSSLLNMKGSVSVLRPKTDRSTPISKLSTGKRRRSISSLLESASTTSQLYLNVFATLQNRHERRRSTGHLSSKNLLNQIKNVNSMSTKEHCELEQVQGTLR